ncbi:hypothetical protein ON010_g2586 [Phytophthora cinnamomi]|nr:hypothetical protein ON010_g2586 [Phytophthora cinnamomi]
MNSRSPHYAAALFVCQHWFSAKERCLLQAVATIDAFLGPLSPRKALNAACQAGALESTLEYFLSRTTPKWNEALRAAVQGGHLHVLRWMTSRRDGRCPWKADFDNMLEVAASHGHLEVVKWLFERGTDRYTVLMLDKSTQGYYAKVWSYKLNVSKGQQVAAANGHFAVVQWLHGARSDTASRHGSPLSRAVANGHLDIAQWLHNAHGDECSAPAVIEAGPSSHSSRYLRCEAHRICYTDLAPRRVERKQSSCNIITLSFCMKRPCQL